jgi:hypothetical protein
LYRSLLFCAFVLVAAIAINVLVLPVAHSQIPGASQLAQSCGYARCELVIGEPVR